jgi:hypothetical protein
MVGLANALRILGFTSEGPGPIRVRGVGLNELTTVMIPYKVIWFTKKPGLQMTKPGIARLCHEVLTIGKGYLVFFTLFDVII